MTTVSYCKSWFRAGKSVIQPWTEEMARAAHASRKPYTALVGDPKSPICFVEVNADYVGVGHLDARLREKLMYQFQEKEPGSLFASMVVYRDFAGDDDKVSAATTYLFSTDGKLQIRREKFAPYSLEVAESEFDAKRNWEKYPDFGHYDGVTKVER